VQITSIQQLKKSVWGICLLMFSLSNEKQMTVGQELFLFCVGKKVIS